LQQKGDGAFLATAQISMQKWREMMRQSEDGLAHPLKPQRVARAFGERLAENTVLATDSGQNTELAARHVDLRAGQAFGVSG
ncbi:MAG: pyruvate oxidase, partial [Mesorhizobium sp.]